MSGAQESTKARHRLRVAALVGVVIGSCARVARRRAKRRNAVAEQAFGRASAGIWPVVPLAPQRPVHIDADRADAEAPRADRADAEAPRAADETVRATGS